MEFLPGEIYHVYNQGNNGQTIFFKRDNYLLFLKKMQTCLTVDCDLLAWCLMPNHFHWIIKVSDNYPLPISNSGHKNDIPAPVVPPLNRKIATLLSSYTKSINNSCDRSGSLFRSRTKAIPLNSDLVTDDNYPIICFLYINQNPVRAGLVNDLKDWKFSSYRDYAGIRNGKLCRIEDAKELFELPVSKEDFIKFSRQTIPERYLRDFI